MRSPRSAPGRARSVIPLSAAALLLAAAVCAPAAPPAGAAPPAAGVPPAPAVPPLATMLRNALPAAVPVDAARAGDLSVEMRWDGDVAHPVLRNLGTRPLAVREVVLFDVRHGLSPQTPYYGEGLQMLAQYGGTLAAPVDYGDYPDRSHYRLPEPTDLDPAFRRVYSVLVLEPAAGPQVLAAFTSCSRFVGAFDVSPTRLRATIDCEGQVLAPGGQWPLEGLMVATGASRADLLARLGAQLTASHPRTGYPAPPAGWCSWYCFGPAVTAKDVLDNLSAIERSHPDLRFVQIDDGYQPTMGDWLDTGPGFGGRPVQDILRQIKERGREPAIWVAPFVASPDSRILRDHPDWFVQGDDGKPLPSDRVMFGGWRLGPWYVLDGTHPEVQAHLERLFATMRREWGVTYFKLDATFWGMIRGGRLHDPAATRVQAYRQGMQAIRRGAGPGAYLLGCNHPIWPSLGLIDGSRSSLDIGRNWTSVSRTGRENLLRGWQNGVLWWNDPDTLVQTGLPDNEARFHATLVYATGGAMLAGDDLATLPAIRVPVLRMLARPTAVAARFPDLRLEVGTIPLPGGVTRHALLNWGEVPADRTITFDGKRRVRDAWTGADLGVHEGSFTVHGLPGHDASLLETAPAP